MPNKDKTGPEGKGPKTGRQMGNCKDAKPVADDEDGSEFQGRGRGQGRGKGFRRQNQKE